MSVQVVNQAVTIDWNMVAGAAATFLVTLWVAYTGRQKAKKKEKDRTETLTFVGSMVNDSHSIMVLNGSMVDLSDEVKLLRNSQERLISELIENRIEIERLTRKLSG